MTPAAAKRRTQGSVRQRGRTFQVRVYAGIDPLTNKDIYLTETAPDEKEAQRVLRRLLTQVDEQRHARTKATLSQALDSWLKVHEAETNTLSGYEANARRYIKPVLGEVAIGKVTTHMLEEVYAQLRRCRARCNGRPSIEHHAAGQHECRTVQHKRPPGRPPASKEAARIIAAAWEQDDDWGTLVWLTMVTGMRRAELLALRWYDVDLDAAMLEIRRNYVRARRQGVEKDTKTHRMRRIALDSETVEVLRAHRDRYEAAARAVGVKPADDAFLFSYDPVHTRPCSPHGVSHRYSLMCERLGIDSHLHALRHYSATELLAAGVDLRTVAGRLGHAGGGTTTLRV